MTGEQRPLPNGYRQGIVTAITVILGFSLLFLRFWAFEAPGEWTAIGALSAVLLVGSIVLEFVALWRSLQLSDDTETEYAKTLRWFLVSAITLFLGVALAEAVHLGIVR